MDIRKIASLKEPPFLNEHPAVWRLLKTAPLYHISDESERIFFDAMKENTLWHYNNNSGYRSFCESRDFIPGNDLAEPDDLSKIPSIFVDIFKENDLATLNDPELFQVSSSGTGGKKTTISLDTETVMRMWVMARAAFKNDDLISDEPVNYVIFAPDPSLSAGHGNAHFFSSIMEFAPAKKIVYALTSDGNGGYRLDMQAIRKAFNKFYSGDIPVRMIGLPALIAKAANELLSGRMTMPKGTLVFTGGGWKGAAHEKIPKNSFRGLLLAAWGIPNQNIRDLYGMTEHAVHYLECSKHNFHAPVYSRVNIVDPLTNKPVAKGENGAIGLVNPGFTTMPFQSIMTADIGTFIRECGCGRGTDAFKVVGRSKKTDYRGCAATTLERVTR